jgi:hypothetical protein
MKIRQGFVSNSSSSSFIIVYRDATVEEANDPHVYLLGRYLSEGRDYFQPDEAMAEMIKAKGIPKGSELIYVYLTGDDEGSISLQKLKGIEDSGNVNIETIEADYHSTDNVDDFEECYYNRWNDED